MNMGNNSTVIADTCIWIEFFRTKSKNSNRMKNLIANNLVVGTGIILAELLQHYEGFFVHWVYSRESKTICFS